MTGLGTLFHQFFLVKVLETELAPGRHAQVRLDAFVHQYVYVFCQGFHTFGYSRIATDCNRAVIRVNPVPQTFYRGVGKMLCLKTGNLEPVCFQYRARTDIMRLEGRLSRGRMVICGGQ